MNKNREAMLVELEELNIFIKDSDVFDNLYDMVDGLEKQFDFYNFCYLDLIRKDDNFTELVVTDEIGERLFTVARLKNIDLR